MRLDRHPTAPISRRTLLRGAGWAAVGASTAALLAACGDPELPDPPQTSGQTASPDPQRVTPVVAVNEREARPQPGAPVTIGVPTGNPLFDQVALRVTGLAADATRAAEAPGELRVVQFEQALTFDATEIATAVEALLASHPQLDAVLLLNADLALLLAARGHVAAVNGPAASAPDFNSADFLPSAIDTLTWDGDLFGLPLWVSVNLLQCSPKLLQDAGVDLESLRDWDWDQFRDTARRLTLADAAGNPSQWGLWMPPTMLPSQQWIWQNGGAVVDLEARRAALESTAALEAVQFLRDLANDDVSPKFDPDASGQSAVAVQITGDGADGRMTIQCAPVAMSGVPIGGLLGGLFGGGAIGNPFGGGALFAPPRRRSAAVESEVFGVLSLLTTSANPDLAFRTLDWVAAQIAPAATVPARGASAEQLRGQGGYDEADARTIVQAVEAARAIPGPYASPIKGAMLKHVDGPMALGQADPSEALTSAAADIDELLQQSAEAALSQTAGAGIQIGTGSSSQVRGG